MPENKEYPDVIKVPSNQPETIVNNSAFTGAIIGDVVGDMTGHRGIGGFIAGGLIGGLLGKDRIMHENREGRPVPKPGSAAVPVAGYGLLGTLTGLAIAASMGAVGPGIVAGLAIGAALGSWLGKATHDHAEKDYEAAKQYYDKHGQYQGKEAEMMKPVNVYIVTPEESRLLEERLSAGKEGKADTYSAEKLVTPTPAR